MASSTSFKLACALFVCMVVVAPHVEAAITCGMVVQKLTACAAYLTGAPAPSPQCCAGVNQLNRMATTTPDRQTACGCLKSAAASVSGLNAKNAAALPGKCGVSIPYPISMSVDCSKVH